MPRISVLYHNGSGFACRHIFLRLQLHCHAFHNQGMRHHTIHWCIKGNTCIAISSGSHSIRQSWDRGDHYTNPQRSNLDGWNHGSHPDEPQPTLCIWDDSPRKTFCRLPNFHSNGGKLIYASVVFQSDYNWSHHKNPHRKRGADVPTCYQFVGTWVVST